MPSAIAGSGMAFDFNWFKDNITKTSEALDDKELEALLLRQRIYIDYFDHILVFDEKTRSSSDFNRQRNRWVFTQFHSVIRNIRHLPHAIVNKQYDLIDKILQWLLVPRTIMMSVIILMSIVLSPIYLTLAIKWWVLAAFILFIFAVATPDYLVDNRWGRSFFIAPIIMFMSIIQVFSIIRGKKRLINRNKS